MLWGTSTTWYSSIMAWHTSLIIFVTMDCTTLNMFWVYFLTIHDHFINLYCYVSSICEKYTEFELCIFCFLSNINLRLFGMVRYVSKNISFKHALHCYFLLQQNKVTRKIQEFCFPLKEKGHHVLK